MADNNSSLTNDLFEAMYTIVTGVVAQQKYDITKECKIIEVYLDDKGKRTGVYKVKNQDAVYDAYAKQGDIYSAGQNVYVQIPNGDFNQQKFIIGLKIDTEDEQDVYNLKLPFDDFIGFYNLTYYTPMQSVGYWANCDYHGDSKDMVATSDFPMSEDHVWHWENVEHRPIIASKLGIEVDVTTLLHSFRPSAGKYGFRIVVRGQYTEDDVTDTREEQVREYYFTNDNMYGNPYAYTLPSTQQIVIDTTNFKSYESIDIWFWQDHEHPFLDELGKEIPWGGLSEEELASLREKYFGQINAISNDNSISESDKDVLINSLMQQYIEETSNSAELKNILFDNLHVLLGMSVEEANEETVTIYTYDTTTYGEDPNNAAVREEYRTLQAAWVHKVNDTLELIDTYNRIQELNAKVYWYNYDPEWAPENPEYDAENITHKLGGNYWRPYPYVETKYPENTPITFQVKPNRNKARDRFKCVIHYDNTYVTSNVFIFQNFNLSIESDNANLARNDRIILRCATLQPSGYTIYDKDGKEVGSSSEYIKPGAGKYFKNSQGKMELLTELHTIQANDNETLVPNDSLGNFFVYNENNNILTNDDNVLFSDVQYFIEPWIRVDSHLAKDYINTDESTYVRLSEYTNEDGIKPNFKITWQFPESFTMIRSWGLIDDEARNIKYWNNRSDALFELDKQATRYFYIDAIHNIRYNDNEISANIEIEGMGTFNVKKELMFGRAGAFGCEFNPVIMISEPAGNFYVDTAGEFEIRCLVYDRTGGLMPEEDRAQCKFEWKYIGTQAKPLDNRDHLSYGGFIGNVIRGRITQPIPFVIEVTVSGAAAYDITVRRGIMVCNNTNFMLSHDIVVPSRIEFRSDGQAPIFASNVFEVQKIIGGTIPVKNDAIDAQNELIYPEWKINQTKVLYLIEQKNEYPMFTLPDGSIQTRPDYTTYSLGFSASKLNTNVANPSAYAQQWTEDLLTDDYFTYIYFEWEGATVAQGIAFAQNLYPSSLVNEWDGQSLSLDYENSAIIAKMIAAGTKDQRNRFTGVMMGDWHEKADESLDTPGLYGFNAGQQSFGFKTDGTGFIGPSGEGRIQFDGRNALISNSTYTNYINLNPRRIENYLSKDDNGGYIIDNQAWDSIGNQSISQYFLYSKAPRRITTFGTETQEAWKEIQMKYWDQNPDLIWVKSFFEDESHDYFLVDPSYGIVTTGGIFARYGRIGKNHPWIISDYGLTQKNNFGRIFLGDPEKNLSIGTYIPNPTFTDEKGDEINTYTKVLDDGSTTIVTIPENFFTISVANVNNVIQTGIRSDGYLYTKYATIGYWYVNDYEIYSPSDRVSFKGGQAQGFRKFCQKFLDDKNQPAGFRPGITADGYTTQGDYIHLNSYRSFIAFNKGKMIIDGQNGWIGLYDDPKNFGIELAQIPSYYNMLIDLKNGGIGFSKLPNPPDGRDMPVSFISGTKGNAYFSKGNIYMDGETATIWCGLHKEFVTEVKNKDTVIGKAVISQTKGTLFLAGMKLEGITTGQPTFTYDGVGEIYISDTEQVLTEGTILLFDTGDYEPISTTPNIELQEGGGNPTDGGELTGNEDDNSDSSDSGDSGGSGSGDSGGSGSSSGDTTDPTTIEGIGKLRLDYIDMENKYFSLNEIEKYSPSPVGAFTMTYEAATGNSQGVGLAVTVSGKNFALMPTEQADKGYFVGDWYLDIQEAIVQKTLSANSLIGDTIYMGPDEALRLVATQEWVEVEIVKKKIWPELLAVNNAAAAAMKKAKQALSKAISALNKANNALGKIKETAIVTVSSEMKNLGQPGGRVDFWFGTQTNSKKFHTWGAAWQHAHHAKLTLNGGFLKATVISNGTTGDPQANGLDLASTVKDMVGDPSAGTLSWSTYGGEKGNFNIADTPFFKDRAFKEFKPIAGGGSQGVGDGGSIAAMSISDKQLGVAGVKLKLSDNSSTAVVQAQHAGTTICQLSLNNYYKAAYNAGWKAAADGSGRSKNTVTYPSSTVGTFSSETASADYSDSHRVSLTGETTITAAHVGKTFYTGAKLKGSVSAWVDWS